MGYQYRKKNNQGGCGWDCDVRKTVLQEVKSKRKVKSGRVKWSTDNMEGEKRKVR